MTKIPFSGRLDLALACLLVAERHHAMANRSVTPRDVAGDVLDLLDLLDVEADDLTTLDEFEEAVDAAMGELVDAGWLRRRCYGSVVRYTTPSLGEDALEWIRDRLSADPQKRRAFDELESEVTELVLERFGEPRREDAGDAAGDADDADGDDADGDAGEEDADFDEDLIAEKEPITGEI